jgi:AraC-like DNA-binding protein
MARLNDSRIASVLGDSYAVRMSRSTHASLHAVHGVALFVGLERDVSIRDHAGRTVRGRAVLVPPDIVHAVDSDGPAMGVCYDPERMGALAAYARMQPPRVIAGRTGTRLVEQLRSHRAQLERVEVLSGVAAEAAKWLSESPRPLDRRVAHALEALRSDAPVPDVNISHAHLAELFARDVGISMRTYRLWRRLMRALLAFAHSDATTAAHAAGFADLAHFSRTCRRMLGYTPTVLRDG